MRWTAVALLLPVIAAGAASTTHQAEPASLSRLRYRPAAAAATPLTVDLGVGLWAWPVPWDVDQDGDIDLVVVCPDKPSNGTYFFENRSGRGVKMPVFAPARRLGPGMTYATPSYVDGGLRMLRTNTEWPDFLGTGMTPGREQTLPLPPTAHTTLFGTQTKRAPIRHNVWKYVDFDGDGALDIVQAVEDWSEYGWDDNYDAAGRWITGPLHGVIYVLRNAGTTAAPRYDAPQPLLAGGARLDQPRGNPVPNFIDFDGDGDLDLICGEFVDALTYYENVGTRTAPAYAAGRPVNNSSGNRLRMELEMIVPVAFDWDGDGDADLIVGNEDGRVALVENTGRLDGQRTPIFESPRYFQQEADTLKSGALATPVAVDWDGDGDQDLLSGNTAGFIEFFENLSGPRVEAPRWAAPRRLEADGRVFRVMAGDNGSIQGPIEAKWGYTTFSVADWDGDGRLDIVLNSILGDVVWLRNTGTPTSPRLAAPQPIEVEWTGPPPLLAWGWRKPVGRALLTQWRTTPMVHDFTGDGLPDLAMLDTEGYLALFERATIDGRRVLRPPQRRFVDESGAPLRLSAKTAGASGRRKLAVADWNGDGRFDLIVNSTNANVLVQVAARDGQWVFHDAGTLVPQNIEGHDVSPSVVDFNGDGIPDFVGGAEDGRLYYLRNPRAKPGAPNPPR